MEHFNLESHGFVPLNFLPQVGDKAGEIGLVLEVFVNAVCVMSVPDSF